MGRSQPEGQLWNECNGSLNWVAEGSAEAGIVYATDAAAEKGVRTVAAAPEGSLGTNVLYPAAVIKNTPHPDEAQLFLGFLKSEEAAACFEEYGFTPK